MSDGAALSLSITAVAMGWLISLGLFAVARALNRIIDTFLLRKAVEQSDKEMDEYLEKTGGQL